MDAAKSAKINKILEIRVGSHLFGTNTSDSDLDLFGIFMPFEEIIYGFQRCEEVKQDKVSKDLSGRNNKDAVDCTLTEYRNFINLALQNNPNILNILFVNDPNIIYLNDYGQRLIDMAEKFPHRGAHHRFVAYADSQLHKMRIKPEKYKELHDGLKILEGMNDKFVLADLTNHVDINNSPFNDTGKFIKCGDVSIERGTFVKKAIRMIRERLDKFTHRSSMYLTYGYDLKYASNLIQLLYQSVELMETGRLQFPLTYADKILDIKHGKYKIEEIIEWAEDLKESSRRAYETSELPKKPRDAEIKAFALNEVKQYSRSYFL